MMAYVMIVIGAAATAHLFGMLLDKLERRR